MQYDSLKEFSCSKPPQTEEELRIENRELRMSTFVPMKYIRWLAANVPEDTQFINIIYNDYTNNYRDWCENHWRG